MLCFTQNHIFVLSIDRNQGVEYCTQNQHFLVYSRRITREKKTFFRLRSSRMRGIIILVGTKFIITRVSNFFSYILIFTTVPYKKKSSLTSFLLVWDDFNLFRRFLWWCGWLCESHFDHRRRRRRRLSFTGLVAAAWQFGEQAVVAMLHYY